MENIEKEDFKQVAREWAEDTLSKLSKTSFEEVPKQLSEFLILGSLVYDKQGNWIPRLTTTDFFEIRPVQTKNHYCQASKEKCDKQCKNCKDGEY